MPQKKKKTPILPTAFKVFIKRALIKFSGLALVGLGVLGLMALFSYMPSDASLNTAATASSSNLLSFFGAVYADLLWQLCGIGAILLPVAFVVWGVWILGNVRPSFVFLRVCALFCALVLFGTGVAGLFLPLFWPAVAGAEGVIGKICFDFLLGKLVLLNTDIDTLWLSVALTGVIFIGALELLAFALSFSIWNFVKRLFVLCQKGGVFLFTLIFRRKVKKEEVFSDTAAEEEKTEKKEKTKGKAKPAVKSLALKKDKNVGFELPSVEFLGLPKTSGIKFNKAALEQKARELENVLREFGIEGEIVDFFPGPVVTLYELNPAPGIKSSRIITLADDIARSMSAGSVRIAVIPGKSYIGIELPNKERESVFLRELFDTKQFKEASQKLCLALGKDIGGTPYYADLATMPHLLVAGTTGSGKSVAVNTMILSLLYRLTPEECRLIMVDPKMLELSVYNGIPHLLTPVVTESKKAIVALKWAVREMEDRYRAMSQMGVRNIDGYNNKLAEIRAKGETPTRLVQVGFDENGAPIMEQQLLNLTPLPRIVVVVDEMADLMIVAGKDVEAAIQRLAQMARAAGIHLIMATQRPSVDVITGTIKSNFPTRISFQVTSKIDSRTILNEQGAEQLLGKGDMLFMEAGHKPERVHGAFVSDSEVESIVDFLKAQGEPEYLETVTADEEDDPLASVLGGGDDGDDLYMQAINIVRNDRKPTISYLQRQLKIGYNRAATLIEKMEKDGIVSAPDHTGKREILLPE